MEELCRKFFLQKRSLDTEVYVRVWRVDVFKRFFVKKVLVFEDLGFNIRFFSADDLQRDYIFSMKLLTTSIYNVRNSSTMHKLSSKNIRI